MIEPMPTQVGTPPSLWSERQPDHFQSEKSQFDRTEIEIDRPDVSFSPVEWPLTHLGRA